jgi:hypothetical protein
MGLWVLEGTLVSRARMRVRYSSHNGVFRRLPEPVSAHVQRPFSRSLGLPEERQAWRGRGDQ